MSTRKNWLIDLPRNTTLLVFDDAENAILRETDQGWFKAEED